MKIKFSNTYINLPENFYSKINPVSVKSPGLLIFNTALAKDLGISDEDLDTRELAAIFSGNKILQGSAPIALVYAGHQYGYFVPQLGDGRAILLGEVIDGNGKRRDIQLKGSGQTPYSRQGDGRAALGPMVREYIVSEAMYALGIKTTRSLAIVTTGEVIPREAIVPGAILTRVAESHIRIGTFEYFAAKEDLKSLQLLADYVINRHYPGAKETPNPYISLLDYVCDAQASLIADWMRVGFVHGVMNTDNMALSGETIDYGPCAFIDEYNPDKVFSSIDRYGRYSFNNQANIAHWNLMRLGETLAPLINKDFTKAKEQINTKMHEFKLKYEKRYLEVMSRKIGIPSPDSKSKSLIEELLIILEDEEADYTLAFRVIAHELDDSKLLDKKLFIKTKNMYQWLEKWKAYLKEKGIPLNEAAEIMFKVNPAYIPRNHKIEEVIQSVMEDGNATKMYKLVKALSKPYKEEFVEYMKPPLVHERIIKTFCGT